MFQSVRLVSKREKPSYKDRFCEASALVVDNCTRSVILKSTKSSRQLYTSCKIRNEYQDFELTQYFYHSLDPKDLLGFGSVCSSRC